MPTEDPVGTLTEQAARQAGPSLALAFEPLAVTSLNAHLGVERKTPSMLPVTHRGVGQMFYEWILAWFNPRPAYGEAMLAA